MLILAVSISTILTSRLNHDLELLKVHGEFMMAGNKIEPTDPHSIQSLGNAVIKLKWITYAVVGGAFATLYGGLVMIVRRSWRTITTQRSKLESVNADLEIMVEERTAKLKSANDRLRDEIVERKQLEEQLVQSQKMEAIGLLAGGVAHDFNNLLTPIMGYAQIEMSKLSPDDKSYAHLQEINKSAERASDLTHQLLAFSRRQIIEPKVINLNDSILNMERMLRRLIGEDVELVIRPAPDLGLVKVDPGQIDQIVMNLAVNARDAMPNGGLLTIGTANVTLDDDYARDHIDVSPGPYVMLAIYDNGTGMPEEVRAHIFEPFFTTKALGKGTGLGLSTCYGIAKQNGGNITVYSEPGRGTTFKIYLPLVHEEASLLPSGDDHDNLPQGTETVLLVEDEPSVLAMVAYILREQGYAVLEASNGVDALGMARGHIGKEIHLLLTDVVMPIMGGKELADLFVALYPDANVLYMSGYTDEAIVRHGVLEPGTEFISKPLTPNSLGSKVRQILDRRLVLGI